MMLFFSDMCKAIQLNNLILSCAIHVFTIQLIASFPMAVCRQMEMLLQAILFCLVEPLAASINATSDHWSIRDYGARLLAYVTE